MAMGLIYPFKKRGRGRPRKTNVAQQVRNIINKTAEVKFHDATTSAAVTTASGFHHATNIAEGDDYNERIGRKINLLSLLVKGYITCITTSDIVRVYVVYDKEPQQTQPAIADILVADGVNTFPNINNVQRFKILYDRVFNLTLQDGAETTQQKFKFYKRFKNAEISWKTDGANLPNKGGIYVYAVALNNAAATVNWSVNSRLRFTD